MLYVCYLFNLPLPIEKFLSYIAHFINNPEMFILAHRWITSVGEIPGIEIITRVFRLPV